jgi:acetylornithine deacetylase
MIERLIGFDTTSRVSNLGLIEWVRDWLRTLGVESRLVYNAARNKANLFATITGRRDVRDRPGIVLSGHTDVVPVDGQAWDTDPFVATVKDGRLYARGACDMKSYIGTALAYVPRFIEADLNAPIHLALSYDEEVGCLGVRGLLEALQRENFRAAGCIVGEPTDMKVVVAHKGKRAFRCRVHGREAHSSLTPLGVNAIEYAARLINHIREMADRMAAQETREAGFDVPFTTLQTGVISGGVVANIVPRLCEFHFEFRYLPGANPDALEAEIRGYAESLLPGMRRVAPEARIEIDLKAAIPGSDAAETDLITTLALSLARNPGTSKVAYATEAGLFRQAHIPAVICGPGSIEQAHKPNEFVTFSQIHACEQFMARLVRQLSRRPATEAR